MTEKIKRQQTKKEFVLQQLQEIYSSFSHLSRTDRILSYVYHFCQNFQYDTKTRDEYLLAKEPFSESFAQNEDLLFKLFTTKKGVCMQFAQALALLSTIDNSLTKDMPNFVYAEGMIQTKSQSKLGHSINLIFLRRKQPIVIDLSSMIHARDGEFKQEKAAFGMVYLSEYLKNLANEGVAFLPTESGLSLKCFRLDNLSVDEAYNLLNTPSKKMTQTDKKNIFYFNLSKK